MTTTNKDSNMTTEQEIQANGLTAPRVTLADIEAEIASEHYFTAEDGVTGAGFSGNTKQFCPPTLSLLTFCVLVLRNGIKATGESACISPENFNAEIGRRIARENAIEKCWPMLGYALADRLRKGANE